jgi:hypothetical protein
MESKVSAVQWLQEAISKKLSSEISPYFLDLFDQAKEMEKQQIMDIDYRLSVIEDYAKGEAGDEITNLRKYINETYGK